MRFFWSVLLPLSRTNIAALFVIHVHLRLEPVPVAALVTTSRGARRSSSASCKMIGSGESQTDWNLIMAVAMLALLPPVLVIVLMQRWFVKGLVDAEK
jgi:sn-glycerol 3-phosphate transport system permease protein